MWLCGRFAREFDGVAVSMPASDRARALIGWLALHPGTHPRSYLAARLWPDVPDASARASLRTAIWAVRQARGAAADQVLECSRNSIGLRNGALWADALDAAPGQQVVGLVEPARELARIEHERAALATAAHQR